MPNPNFWHKRKSNKSLIIPKQKVRVNNKIKGKFTWIFIKIISWESDYLLSFLMQNDFNKMSVSHPPLNTLIPSFLLFNEYEKIIFMRWLPFFLFFLQLVSQIDIFIFFQSHSGIVDLWYHYIYDGGSEVMNWIVLDPSSVNSKYSLGIQ